MRGIASLICSLLLTSQAPALLKPGDVALTGFNMDNPDELAFIALTDINEAEVIHFTDKGWMASGSLRTGEGTMTYTVPSGGLSAGTVITQAVSEMLLSASGDQILVYQGDSSAPTFIYALNSEGSEWQNDAGSANESALPAGLTNGTTAIAIPETDNAHFDFSVISSGTKADWLAAISDPANWIGNNTTRYVLPSDSHTVQSSTAPNVPPLLDIEPPGTNITTEAEHEVCFSISATQLDGDETDITSLSAVGLPVGAVFSNVAHAGSITNTFTWTPAATQTGLFTVGFTATDKDGTNSMYVNITVGAVTSTPPILEPIHDQTTYLGNALISEITATATEADTVTLSAQNLPPGATFNVTGNSGTFEWLSPDTVGDFTPTFLAVDDDGTNAQTITISVYELRTIEFTGTDLTIEEQSSQNIISVHLSGEEGSSATVLTSGSATEHVDYQLSTNTIRFIGSEQAVLTLTVLTDSLEEGAESIMLTLTNATGSNIGTKDTLHITLRDDDCFSVASANLGSQIAPTDTCYEEFAGRIFEGIAADIVAVQEFNVTNRNVYTGYRDFVDRHFGTGFHVHVETENIYGKMPNGIISRWPIIDAGEWEDAELFNRDFAWATIQIPGDRLLHVISVHLKAGDSEEDIVRRVSEVQQLTNDIFTTFSTTNFIALCGDFNLTDRDEPTLLALTNAFPYTHTPKDQYGYKNTNKNRQSPFDWVMPSALLNTCSTTTRIDGTAFPEGAVFDSRLWGTPPYPVQTNDSVGEGLQHMAVIRSFSFTPESSTDDSTSLVLYSFDGATDGTNTAATIHSNATASVFDSADQSISYLQGEPSSGYAIRDTGWDSFDHYFAFTVSIADGYQAFLTAMQFDGLRGGTGPTRWSVRSSIDNYTSNLGSGDYVLEDAWCSTMVALGLNLITGDITFRLYGYDAETAYGNWRIDNVELIGSINQIDPNDQDADNLPDTWELTYFVSLDMADDHTDNDHDGATDREEYLAGTLPNDDTSIFCTSCTRTLTQQTVLTWPSADNRTYTILYATNLTEGFTAFISDIPSTPPLNTYTTTVSSTGSTYYKIGARLID